MRSVRVPISALLSSRAVRALTTMGMLPVLLLGTLASDGILIHLHPGHGLHLHRPAHDNPGAREQALGACHDEQEHADAGTDVPEHCTRLFVLLLDVSRVDLRRAGDVVSPRASSPSTTSMVALTHEAARRPSCRPDTVWICSHPGSKGTVASILANNHALLL